METLKLFRRVALFLFLFYFCVTAQREIECNGRDFQCEDSMRFITCVYLTDGQKLFKFDKCANGTFCNEENRPTEPCGDSQAVAKSTISTAPTSTADPATTLKEATTIPYFRATIAPGYNTTDLNIARVNSTNGFSVNSNVQISSNAGNMALNVSTLMSLEPPLTLKSSSIITWNKDGSANNSTKLNGSRTIETNTTVEQLSDTPKMGSVLISTLTQAFFSLTQFKSQSVVTFTNRNAQQFGLDPSPVSVNVATGFDSIKTNNMSSVITNTTISFGDPPPMPERLQNEEVVENMTVGVKRSEIPLDRSNLKASKGESRLDIVESDFEDASLNTTRSEIVTENRLPEEESVDEVQFSSLASAVSKQDPTQTDYVAEEATEPFDIGINIADESKVEPAVLADNTSYAGNIGEIYIKSGHTSVYDAEPTQNEDPHFPTISPPQNDFAVPESTIRIDVSNDTNKGLNQNVTITTTELTATATTDVLDEEFFDFDDATRKAKLPSLRTTDNPGIIVTSNYLGRNVRTQIEPTVLPILADGSKQLNLISKDNKTVSMIVNSPSPLPVETQNSESIAILATSEPQTVKSFEFRTPAAFNLEMNTRPDWATTEVFEDTTEAATTVMEHTAPTEEGELLSTHRIENFDLSDHLTIPVNESTTVTYLGQNEGNNQQFLPEAERTDVEEPLKNAAGVTVSPNWPSLNSVKTHPAVSETTFAGLSTEMPIGIVTTTAQHKEEIHESGNEQVMIPMEGKGISSREVFRTSSEPILKQNTEPTQKSTVSSVPEIIEEFTCPSHGVFADESDCRKYYLCIQQLVGYVKLPISCSSRSSFDPISQRCVRDVNNCSPEKCKRQGNFTDPSDKTSYFECKEVLPGVFHKYHEQCAAPLKFISSLNGCGIASETGNSDREKTTAGTGILIEHRYQEMPATTNKFEKSLVESFPVDEDHHMLGEADHQKSQATENPKSSKRTVRSISRVTPLEFECKQTGLFPHETDCRKYYMCIESTGRNLIRVPGYCPSRYAFHPISSYCSRDLSVCSSMICNGPGNFPDPEDDTRFYRCVPNVTGGYRIYHMEHRNRPGSASTASFRPASSSPISVQPTQTTVAPTSPSPTPTSTSTTTPPTSSRPLLTHLEPSPDPFDPPANQSTSSVGSSLSGSPSGVSTQSHIPHDPSPSGTLSPQSPDPYGPTLVEPSPDINAPSAMEPGPGPSGPSPDPYAPSHLEPSPDPNAPSHLEPSPDLYRPSHLEPSPAPSHPKPLPDPHGQPLKPFPDPYGSPSFSYGPSSVDPQHSVDPVHPVSPARPMPSRPTHPPSPQPTHPTYSTRPSPVPSHPVPTAHSAPASWSIPPRPITTPRPVTVSHAAPTSRPSFTAPVSRPTRPPYSFGTTLPTSPDYGYPAYPSRPVPTARPPQPNSAVRPPQPDSAVRPPQPDPAVRPPQPDLAIRPPQPDPAIRPPQPGPAVRPPQPDLVVRPPQPDPVVRPPQPDPTVRPPQPDPTVRPPQPDSTVRPPQPGLTTRPPQLGPAARPLHAGPTTRPPQSSPAARPPQSILALRPPQSGPTHFPPRPEYSAGPLLPLPPPAYRPEYSPGPSSSFPIRPNRPFVRPTTFTPPTRPSSSTAHPTRPVYFFGPDYNPSASVNPPHSIDPSYNPDPAGPDFAYGFGHGPSFSQSNSPSRPGFSHVPNFAAGPDPDFFPDPIPYAHGQRWRRSTLESSVDESEASVKQSTASSQVVVDENYRRMAELQLRKILVEMRKKAKEQSDYEERNAYQDILNKEDKREGQESNTDFSCSATGRFANPKNCKRYFICSQKEDEEFKMFDLKCRGSDKFDYRKRICVEEDDAHCA